MNDTDNKTEVEEVKVEEAVEEKKETPKKRRTKKSEETVSFNFDDYMFKTVVERIDDSRPVAVEVEGFKDKYKNRKFKVKTARFFDVPLDHLEEAYYILNGKKLDGFFINDIFDRHGYSSAIPMSRKMLCAKYNFTENVTLVDVAESKLKNIIKQKDIKKAYVKHIKEIRDEMEKEIKETAIYGEA